jgi:hypothetical protein
VELQVNFESNGSFADVRLASGLLQEARHMHYSLHLPPKKLGMSHPKKMIAPLRSYASRTRRQGADPPMGIGDGGAPPSPTIGDGDGGASLSPDKSGTVTVPGTVPDCMIVGARRVPSSRRAVRTLILIAGSRMSSCLARFDVIRVTGGMVCSAGSAGGHGPGPAVPVSTALARWG